MFSTVDFTSLYPSVMISYAYPLTFVSDDDIKSSKPDDIDDYARDKKLHLDNEAIETVMSQANCNRADAINVLERRGNLIDAILLLHQ